MSVFTQGHALVIGAGSDLPETVQDAEFLAKLLKDPERCAYPPEQVRLLTEAGAGRQAILDSLEALAGDCQPESTLLVFYSGHGYRVSRPAVGEQFYLMPNGYNLADLAGTAVRGKEIAEALAKIPAQKLLLIFDCCHAGGVGDEATSMAPGLAFSKAPLPPEVLDLLRSGRGKALIASSKADELSYGGKPLTAFGLALVEALCGEGAAVGDGCVRLADLALHTRQVVPQRTRDRQHPILDFDQADNFVVAYYAAGKTKKMGLPFDQEPRIEPQPGAWRSQEIHVGGGVFGQFEGTYVQRDQINIQHYEDRSVRGPITNSTVVTGDKNRIGPAPSLEGLQQLLQELKAGLEQSSLPEPERAGPSADLDDAADEAARPEPNRYRLLSRLAGVVEFLANSATIAVSAPQLVELGKKALEWAQALFGG